MYSLLDVEMQAIAFFFKLGSGCLTHLELSNDDFALYLSLWLCWLIRQKYFITLAWLPYIKTIQLGIRLLGAILMAKIDRSHAACYAK